jgi:hypothetical protein
MYLGREELLEVALIRKGMQQDPREGVQKVNSGFSIGRFHIPILGRLK